AEQLVRELPRDVPPLVHRPEHHADDADVHLDRLFDEPRVLDRPVEALDRLAEAFRDDPRGAEVVEIGNEEAELVAAKARVQLLRAREIVALLRNQVVGPDLLAQQPRDALDNPIAERVPERVVVPLERGDIDEADGAPAAALLERQERLELLD